VFVYTDEEDRMATRAGLLISILLITAPAYSTFCSTTPSVEDAYRQSSVVLLAKVVKQSRFSTVSTVEVERVF